MNGRIMEAVHDMKGAIEVRNFYVLLLEDTGGILNYFLGIDGQLRRNACAYRLAQVVHHNLMTCEEAIGKLRRFSNDIIEKGWIQLPLWNQSKLDQL